MRSIGSAAVDISLGLHFLRVCFKCLLRNTFDSVETVVVIGQLMITRFSLQWFARPLTATRKIMCLGRLPDHVQAPFGVVSGARQELIHLVCFIAPPISKQQAQHERAQSVGMSPGALRSAHEYNIHLIQARFILSSVARDGS